MNFNEVQTWVIIASALFFISFFAVLIFKRGGTIETKKLGVFIPKSVDKEDPLLARRLNKVYKTLPLIRYALEQTYLTTAKRVGIKPEYLIDDEDTKFYFQCLGNIIYSGNGISSIKSQIETTISECEYTKLKGEDFTKFIDTVMLGIRQAINKYLNANYDSHVVTKSGELRDRAVDSVTLYKANEELLASELRRFIEDIFHSAIRFGCEE